MQDALNQDAWAQSSGAKVLDMQEMENLIETYNKKWEEYDAKNKVAKEAYAEFQTVEQSIIKALVDAQKTSYKSETGTVTLSHRTSVKVPGSLTAKERFFSYLRDMSDELYYDMVTVNSNRLNSWYKKVKEEAGDAPGFSVPGIEEGSQQVTLQFRAAKKG